MIVIFPIRSFNYYSVHYYSQHIIKVNLVNAMSYENIITFLNLCVKTLSDSHFETDGTIHK